MKLGNALLAASLLLPAQGCKTRLLDPQFDANPDMLDMQTSPDAGSFCPSDTVYPYTKSEIVRMIDQCLHQYEPVQCAKDPNCSAPEEDKKFTPAESIESLERLCAEGYIEKVLDTSGDLTYAPGAPVTRAEFAVAVYKILGFPPASNSGDRWWSEAFKSLREYGLVPDGEEDRVECAPSKEFLNSVVDWCLAGSKIDIKRSPDSHDREVARGSTDVNLGTFLVQASPVDGAKLTAISLDLSSGMDRTLASDGVSNMDCPDPEKCDLTGAIQIKIGDQVVATLSANNPALWNNSGCAKPIQLATQYEFRPGELQPLYVTTNLSGGSNLGKGETISANVTRIDYEKTGSRTSGISAGAQGSLITAQ